MQVLYLGRAPRTKETLPDFREKCRVTRHSRVFRGLTGSQRTPEFGASHFITILNISETIYTCGPAFFNVRPHSMGETRFLFCWKTI